MRRTQRLPVFCVVGIRKESKLRGRHSKLIGGGELFWSASDIESDTGLNQLMTKTQRRSKVTAIMELGKRMECGCALFGALGRLKMGKEGPGSRVGFVKWQGGQQEGRNSQVLANE